MNPSLKTLILVTSSSVAALSFGLSASAATFSSSTISLSSSPTPFPNPVISGSFSKFDSTGKTITAVRVYLDAALTGNVTFTNANDGLTRTVNEYTQRGTLRARGPNGVPSLIQIIPQQTIVDPGSPLTLASGASQGFNFNASAGPVNATVVQGNWSLFTAAGGGSGEVDFSGTASALSDIQNGINATTTASLAGNFRFEVDYNENPTPPTSVPEPTAILGFLAFAGTGLLSRHKS